MGMRRARGELGDRRGHGLLAARQGITVRRSVITDLGVVIDIEADGETILLDLEGEETLRFTADEATRIGRALLEVAANCGLRAKVRTDEAD